MSVDSTTAASMVSQALTKASASKQAELEQAELKKACAMFESQFLKMLWKEMRSTVQKGGLVNGGFGEDLFTDMMDEAVSDRFTASGSMGLARMLEAQLGKKAYAHPGAKIGQDLGGSTLGGNALSTGSLTTSSPSTGSLGSAAEDEDAISTSALTLPVDGVVSSSFGLRVHPITGQEEDHQGLDLAADEGTPIAAAAAGQVSFAGDSGGYGNLVVVTHADGSSAYYAHCQDIAVEEGQAVAAGQTLATVGSTGLSTGPHLHFELRDAEGQAIDPSAALASAGLSAQA